MILLEKGSIEYKNDRIVRISRSSLVKLGCLFLLIPFFKPAFFSTVSILDRIYDVMQLCSFFTGVLLFASHKKVRRISVIALLYYLYLITITAFRGGDLYRIIAQAASSIGVIMVLYGTYYMIGDEVIDSVAIIMELLAIGNLVSVIMYPNGMYRFQNASGWWSDASWFLGLRNGMTSIYIMGFLVMLIWAKTQGTKKSRIRIAWYTVITSITILLINVSPVLKTSGRNAGALLICWGLVILYCIWPRISELLSIELAIVSNILLSVALVFFEVSRVISYTIERIFQKNTLRGRTMIWNAATQVISQNPLFGVGIERGVEMSDKLMSKAAVATTHNGFLDVLYFGGIVGVTIVAGLFIVLCLEIRDNKEKMGNLYASISYVLFAYLMSGQSESLISTRFFVVVTIIDIIAMRSGDEKRLKK